MLRMPAVVVGLAVLLGTGSASAGQSNPQPGERVRETRQIGNKLTVDVYRRVPYALTGDVRQNRAEAPHERKHETRQIGNKLTVDVYHH